MVHVPFIARAVSTETVNRPPHNTNIIMGNSLVLWTHCAKDAHDVSTRNANTAKVLASAKQPIINDLDNTNPLKVGNGASFLSYCCIWVGKLELFNVEGVKCNSLAVLGFL